MTQLYKFTDDNGVTRLEARQMPEPVPAAGTLIPVANVTGVIVDTTTYNDTVKGSGKLTTLVFPVSQGALAIALAGDAFPRLVMGSDPTAVGLVIGDGTVDPTGAQTVGMTVNSGDRTFQLASPHQVAGPGAASSGGYPQLYQVSPLFDITSGALPTKQLVTATGAQIATDKDVETVTPCTFNPGAATTATVTVALSPDNVTYSTLGVETEPAGVAFDGTIHLIKVRVPAGWYLKLTVNAQAVLGLTTYY